MMKSLAAIILALYLSIPFALAGEPGDFLFMGLELEKLLNLGSGLLAAGLFIATFFSYRRTGNRRLVYVSVAFLLFAVKGFLTSHELFFSEWVWVDPLASGLNFAIIIAFFFGVMHKD